MNYEVTELNMTFILQVFNTLLLLGVLCVVFIIVPYYLLSKRKKNKEIEKRLAAIELRLETLEKPSI